MSFALSPPPRTLAASDEPAQSTTQARVASRALTDAAGFSALYEETIEFVYRSVRRLGAPASSLDDVVQDVYVVAHKKLPSFRGESSLRTWLYGIVLHVVRHHRRSATRAGLHGTIDQRGELDPEHVADREQLRPDRQAERSDAYRTLLRVLDRLDDDKRELFVLAELEELPVTEIAALYGVKANTAYSRLRLAREAFERALEREMRTP